MANDLADVTPKLIAAAVPVIRENSVMPRLVNSDISAQAAQRGSTVDVPVPTDFEVSDVTPSMLQTQPDDMTINTVPVPLNKWRKVTLYLTDKDMIEIVDNNILSEQMKGAIKALANDVDKYLLGLYVEFYGYHGTAGTTPFANEKPNDAAQLRKVLNNQLAPTFPRHVVMNADAEANALSVPAFANAQWHGDPQAIIDGILNRRVGFDWWMDQNVREHTAGDAAGHTVSGALSEGDTTVALTGGTGTFVVGDIIHFANHTQSYVVTSATGSPSSSMTIRPPLAMAVPDTTAITSLDDHVANIGFHPVAFAFASRPMARTPEGLGVIEEIVVDDLSQLALRMQIRYHNYQTVWTIDILYGGQVVRPELGARLLG